MAVATINLFEVGDGDDNDDVPEFKGDLDALIATLTNEKTHLENELNLAEGLKLQDEQIKGMKLAYDRLQEEFQKETEAYAEQINIHVSVEATVDAQGDTIAKLLERNNELECGLALVRDTRDIYAGSINELQQRYSSVVNSCLTIVSRAIKSRKKGGSRTALLEMRELLKTK